MDGARLWEAISFYDQGTEENSEETFKEISQKDTSTSSSTISISSIKWHNPSRKTAIQIASLFDSIYVSFYKGIAANLCGSVLLSKDARYSIFICITPSLYLDMYIYLIPITAF